MRGSYIWLWNCEALWVYNTERVAFGSIVGSIGATFVELQCVWLTISSSVYDAGVHQLLGIHAVRGRSPRNGDGGGDCHDRCHHPQTPKSGCLEVGIVVRNTVLPRGGADEDAHRQLHLVHRLRVAHLSLQVGDEDSPCFLAFSSCYSHCPFSVAVLHIFGGLIITYSRIWLSRISKGIFSWRVFVCCWCLQFFLQVA